MADNFVCIVSGCNNTIDVPELRRLPRSRRDRDPYTASEYREVWERFMNLTEIGDIEEVNKIIETHNMKKISKYHKRPKELCPVCFAISKDRLDVMVELLNRGMKVEGICNGRSSDSFSSNCTASTCAEFHNKKAMAELIVRGWTWEYDNMSSSQRVYESIISPIIRLMEELVRDAYTPSQIKPVRREL